MRSTVLWSLARRRPRHLRSRSTGIDGLTHRETVTDETIGTGAPPATFFDFSAVDLVTTSILASLSRAYPPGRFDWRRFRPNITAESDAEGFPENDSTFA